MRSVPCLPSITTLVALELASFGGPATAETSRPVPTRLQNMGSISLDDSRPMEPERAQKAMVVLRARRLRFLGGSQYIWSRVEVLGVYKNTSPQSIQIGDTIEVAALSSGALELPVPEGECTLYLVPYNICEVTGPPWKLLGGGASEGVSHIRK